MPPSDDRDPVDVLAEEFADRLRRGEHPSVSDYANAHPDHADQLKELLPAVAQMEMLKRFRRPVGVEEKSLPDRLGDFRIVRELGRGGMGVVFEAVQESLDRRVALKVLARHAQLDATRRERFIREAQTAAKLHHTNIVPVFGVGEQDGLPYYVMQLIPGHGLHAVVKQWRKQRNEAGASNRDTIVNRKHDADTGEAATAFDVSEPVSGSPEYGDWRFVAEVGLQAADALHYAHKHGVLHRDVKPGNLILDSGVVWVTDFGLAKMVNTEGLTATGDILGTLQYIPPECLAGNADPRSDVYGLGATLYELLTLEPPYAADSLARLVKQVADTDPPPPRQINPNIPRDLETIVLKAMARDPAHRYSDARELTHDLLAFLEDRPIKARRISPLSHAWRWCRRNPALASLTATTIAALVLAAVAGWVGYAQVNDALGHAEERRKDADHLRVQAEQAKADAERAKTDAQQMSARLEANLKLSLEAFEKVFEATSGTGRQGLGVPLPPMFIRGPDRGPGGPDRGAPVVEVAAFAIARGMLPDRGFGFELAADKAAVLEAILEFYDKFAEQNKENATNTRLQFEAAKASRRVCEANVLLKRPDKALAAYNRAVTLLEALVQKFPTNEAMRTELVITYLIAPPGAFPADREEPFRLAANLASGRSWLTGSVNFSLGRTRELAGNNSGAESAYRDAITAYTSTEQSKRPPHGHLELAFARLRLAAVLTAQEELPDARAVLNESVDELRLVVERSEVRGPNREWLVITCAALFAVCEKLGDSEGKENAKKIADSAKHPGRPEFPGFGFIGGPGGWQYWPGGGPWIWPSGGGWPGSKKEPPKKKD
ncbi:MAG: serine/threonine protein kinase [Planctomycetia bacterium]|nr:serine/threonine protein kinase [Planctomycetia bacterium]